MPRISSLATERLILRPPSPGDLEDFVQLEADADVMRYIGTGQTAGRDAAAAWLERLLAAARDGFPDARPRGVPGWLVVIERQSCAFVGLATLQPLGPVHVAAAGKSMEASGPIIEVGYRLAKSFWGRGYATEAGLALVNYGFEHVGLNRIVAIADVNNAASNRVIQKLGLKLRSTYELNGKSIHLHSIDADQYHSSRSN